MGLGKDLKKTTVDLHEMGRSEGLLELFLNNLRFQDYHFKQLYADKSYLDASPLFQGLKEDPNCYSQIGGNWLGCL